jgi:hypothetical protein
LAKFHFRPEAELPANLTSSSNFQTPQHNTAQHNIHPGPRYNVVSAAVKPLIIHSPPQNLTKRRTFRNLSPKTRILVGVGFLAWGTAGLYISDRAEKKMGFEATEKDREALEGVLPRITVVERDQLRSGGKGES